MADLKEQEREDALDTWVQWCEEPITRINLRYPAGGLIKEDFTANAHIFLELNGTARLLRYQDFEDIIEYIKTKKKARDQGRIWEITVRNPDQSKQEKGYHDAYITDAMANKLRTNPEADIKFTGLNIISNTKVTTTLIHSNETGIDQMIRQAFISKIST
jgi:hypothetical protein